MLAHARVAMHTSSNPSVPPPPPPRARASVPCPCPSPGHNTCSGFVAWLHDLAFLWQIPVVLDGAHGLLEHLAKTVEAKGYAVVVVGEGAGTEILPGVCCTTHHRVVASYPHTLPPPPPTCPTALSPPFPINAPG